MSPLFQDNDWVDDIRKTMFLLKKNNSYSLSRTLILWRVFYYSNVSPVPGHWLGGRHTEDDVPAEEEQFLLSFQDINFVEGILLQQCLPCSRTLTGWTTYGRRCPCWRRTILTLFLGDWLCGGYSTTAMSPLFQDTDWVDDIRKTMSLLKKNSSYSLSRTLILWRVFYYSNVSPVPGNWLGGRHTEDYVSAKELNSFSLFLPSRTSIWWRVFYRQCLPGSRILTGWTTYASRCICWFLIQCFPVPDSHKRI